MWEIFCGNISLRVNSSQSKVKDRSSKGEWQIWCLSQSGSLGPSHPSSPTAPWGSGCELGDGGRSPEQRLAIQVFQTWTVNGKQAVQRGYKCGLAQRLLAKTTWTDIVCSHHSRRVCQTAHSRTGQSSVSKPEAKAARREHYINFQRAPALKTRAGSCSPGQACNSIDVSACASQHCVCKPRQSRA